MSSLRPNGLVGLVALMCACAVACNSEDESGTDPQEPDMSAAEPEAVEPSTDEPEATTDEPTAAEPEATTDEPTAAEPTAAEPEAGEPEVDLDALMPQAPDNETQEVIDMTAGYQDWSTFEENSEIEESSGHRPGGMPMYVISYRNDVVAKAELFGTLPLPEGSVIVKENYADPDGEMLAAVSIMAKLDGEWFWVQMTPDEQVLVTPEGDALAGTDVMMCSSCHSKAAENDYVEVHDFGMATATPEVWKSIEGYQDWSLFAGNPEIQISTGHAPGGNAMNVLTYRNDIVAEAEAEGTLPLPDGSVIVKENYGAPDDAAPMALTIMAKLDSDWFWLQTAPDGTVMETMDGDRREGEDQGCIGCHSGAPDTDMVFLFGSDAPSMMDAGAPSDAGE